MAAPRHYIPFALLAACLFAGCAKDQALTKPLAAGESPALRKHGLTQGDWTLLHSAAAMTYDPPQGVVRIDDITAQKNVVDNTRINPNTAVIVDPANGIQIGPDKLLPGPLPPGHKYELWWKR